MVDLSRFDFSVLPPPLLGRLSFEPAAPTRPPLPAGRQRTGIDDSRDALLFVPDDLPMDAPVPLWVMFHGASGSAEQLLPFVEAHAQRDKFLLLVPQSLLVTWDLALGGNGPDLARLDRALAEIASRYTLDPKRIAFAGFSDGGSYALSIGLTNGRFVTHVFAFSAGFMNLYTPEGKPQVFIAHGDADAPLPAFAHGRVHASKLRKDNYAVEYAGFGGGHLLEPAVVAQAVDRFFDRA